MREAKGTLSADQLNLLVNDVRNLVPANVSAQIDPVLQIAADRYHSMMRISNIVAGPEYGSGGRLLRLFAHSSGPAGAQQGGAGSGDPPYPLLHLLPFSLPSVLCCRCYLNRCAFFRRFPSPISLA